MMKHLTPAFVLASFLICASFAQEAAEAEPPPGKIPLQVNEPRPLFIGTPVPIEMTNLEKPGKRRETVYVEEGVHNLAHNKPVSASDMEPIIGELDMVTDGDISGVDGSYVELGPDLQWVQVDLEKEAEIHAILVWHFHAAPRVYHDTVVQLSNDPDFATGVQTVYNNDHDNSSELGVGEAKAYIDTSEGRLIMVDKIRARYVRFYTNGNHADPMNHYCEVEVHGK